MYVVDHLFWQSLQIYNLKLGAVPLRGHTWDVLMAYRSPEMLWILTNRLIFSDNIPYHNWSHVNVQLFQIVKGAEENMKLRSMPLTFNHSVANVSFRGTWSNTVHCNRSTPYFWARTKSTYMCLVSTFRKLRSIHSVIPCFIISVIPTSVLRAA